MIEYHKFQAHVCAYREKDFRPVIELVGGKRWVVLSLKNFMSTFASKFMAYEVDATSENVLFESRLHWRQFTETNRPVN